MAYLDNSTIVVDAVLTREGRRLLSEGQGLDIRYFTLSDSGVDYTLWNPDHPSGSAFYGEAIENLPSLEAIPRGQFYMRNKLITLGKGTTSIPYFQMAGPGATLTTDFVSVAINDTTDKEVDNYPGVEVHFKLLGSVGEGAYQLTIPNATAISSITPGNVNGSGWNITNLSNEDGQAVTYLQNIEAADAAFYNLNPGNTEFSVKFRRSTVSAVIDCSLISLSTGITKTFRLDITGKTTT
jgi:hypothetical protein